MEPRFSRVRLGAVSYLNTVPLVYGLLHGPERNDAELSFSIPSACSDELEQGKIDAGLVPVAEIARQSLEMVPGLGIACQGEVRSILLLSRVPWNQVRTVAADYSSRTSIQLTRVILRERFGVEARIAPHAPVLDDMLAASDAALIIGDPALQIPLENPSFDWLDLGAEWLALTGLPFVFAAWAGKPGFPLARIGAITRASYEFGKARLLEIADREYRKRCISRALAERYLTHHIRYEIGPKEQAGLEAFLQLAGLRPALAATP